MHHNSDHRFPVCHLSSQAKEKANHLSVPVVKKSVFLQGKHRLHRFLSAALVASTLLLNQPILEAASSPFTTSVVQMMLYVDKQEVFINGSKDLLDVPAQVVNGRMYVPLKFLGDTMGFEVAWEEESRSIVVNTESRNVYFSTEQMTMWMDGIPQPLEDVAMIVDGRLLVQVSWFSQLTGAQTEYNAALNRVEVTFVRQPANTQGIDGSSIPIAKFATDKTIYRIGETIKYYDLSYHPDAEGLREVNWGGRQNAFFEAGEYPVSLVVTDRHGNESQRFTRVIKVSDEVYRGKLEYALHHTPVENFIKTDSSEMKRLVSEQIPVLSKTIRHDDTRSLLVSDSPETFHSTGTLYRDTVNGKARLYATHINGMDVSARFLIMAVNNTDRAVTVKTSNTGEVAPSAYANLIGHIASLDFLVEQTPAPDLVVPPGETRVYVAMSDFLPQQGVNVLYDIETDGEVEFFFIAAEAGTRTPSPYRYPTLDYVNHVRGTFPASDIHWNIDGSNIKQLSKVIIGDNVTDKFVTGYDGLRKQVVDNYGNYGVVYHITIDRPKEMAVLLLARGGTFSGPLLINDEIVRAPKSGVITAFDGVQVLARTSGTEERLTISFIPPSGSYFPVDLLFYPLQDK